MWPLTTLCRRTLRPIIRKILVTSALRWRHMVTSALSPSSRWRRPAFSCTHHQVLRHLQLRDQVLPLSLVQQVPGTGNPIGNFANLKGHGNEADFLGVFHKPVRHRSFTLRFEPFRFDDSPTCRVGESPSFLLNIQKPGRRVSDSPTRRVGE